MMREGEENVNQLKKKMSLMWKIGQKGRFRRVNGAINERKEYKEKKQMYFRGRNVRTTKEEETCDTHRRGEEKADAMEERLMH